MSERGTQTLDIAVIGGDGIGPEVVAEGLKVLEAVTGGSGPKVTTTEIYTLHIVGSVRCV